jgi:DNA replication protein DnaC
MTSCWEFPDESAIRPYRATLPKLNLPAIASQWSHHAQQTLGQDGSYADFVEVILTHEYAARQQRSQQVLMKLSGLPQVKTLEDYDFNYALGAPNHR